MSAICVFDDGQGLLAPLTDLRAAFDIRTGAFTTRDRIERLVQANVLCSVPKHLRDLYHGVDDPLRSLPPAEVVLCLNGRWLDPRPALDLKPGETLRSGGVVLATFLPAAQAIALLRDGGMNSEGQVRNIEDAPLLIHPWDVQRHLSELIRLDLTLLQQSPPRSDLAAVCFGEHPISADPSANLYPGAVLDAEGGPIVIDAHAVVRPHVSIIGPTYIGRGTVVQDGAVIRAGTVVGPRCKVGGEIGASVFQGYSNKGHDGYLGDSYVGEWVNLGAGTITSNLKNTYGPVRVQLSPDEQPQDTGMTFVGSIIGDHVKTAIGTRLMTGSVLMTGAQIAASAPPPKLVQRFAFLTDAGSQRYDLDKFLKVVSLVMQRRDMEMQPAQEARLRELHGHLAG